MESSLGHSNLISLDLMVSPLYCHHVGSNQVPWYTPTWPFTYSPYGYYHSMAPYGTSSSAANRASTDCRNTATAEHLIKPVSDHGAKPVAPCTAEVPRRHPGQEGPSRTNIAVTKERGSTAVKTVLKRLPTPHPQRKRSGAAVPINSGERTTTITNAASKRFSYASSKTSVDGTRKQSKADQRAFMSGGRPLWSGNFAGANSPRRVDPVVRPNFRLSEKSAVSTEARRGVQQGKGHPSGGTVKAATVGPDQAAIPSSSVPHPATSPQLVQYVNYNYRPVVVQSPTCGGIGIVGNASAGHEWQPRHRTTSAMEAAIAVKEA